jgi:hypothetical protein
VGSHLGSTHASSHHPPLFTTNYQPAWERLSGKILDNTVHNSKPYTTDQLSKPTLPPTTGSRGTEINLQVTITIGFADKSKEKYDTKKLYKAWKRITSAIARSHSKNDSPSQKSPHPEAMIDATNYQTGDTSGPHHTFHKRMIYHTQSPMLTRQ